MEINFIGTFIKGQTLEHASENDAKSTAEIEQSFQIFTDVENENQHMNFFENEHYQVLVNGHIYNLDDLIKENKLSIQDERHIAQIIAKLFDLYSVNLYKRLRGQFIIIIWDKNKQILYGARDHFGIKRLYYYENDDSFIFSTNKRVLTSYLEENYSIENKVNLQSLQHYFSFQFVPEPLTINDDIHLVEAGSYFTLKHSKVEFHHFWKPAFQPNTDVDKNELVEKIRNIMTEQVNRCMNDDKRFGSFLSGGIDSTFIVGLAKEINPNIKTFSLGFSMEGFSEVDVAKKTAEIYGVEHICKFITPEEFAEKIPEIIWSLGDPLADPSSIALYFLAEEASKHVDVVLSGEGADELFGGYNIYREPFSLNVFNYVPNFLKPSIRKFAEMFPDQLSGKSFLLRGTTPLDERYIGNAKIFEEKEKEQLLLAYDHAMKYTNITSKYFEEVKNAHPVTQMQYIDIHTWLKGDILFKANTMARANGLEARLPFIDKNVFDVASEIPVNLKIANYTTKYILREAAKDIVPEHVLHRRKLGFPVPIRHWLKRELNSWAQRLIHEGEVDEYINKEYVNELLEAHCSNKGDYSRKIWTILIFIIWHQIFVEKKYDLMMLLDEKQAITQ